MDKLTSRVGIAANTDLDMLIKKQQSSQNPNVRLGTSELVKTANGDVNKLKMLTPAFKNMTIVTAGASGSVYNTLAYRDPNHEPDLLPSLYENGENTVMKKSGKGGVSVNVLLPGQTPTTLDSTESILIQRRSKYFYSNDTSEDSPYFTWRVEAVKVPKDYVMQPNERLDGNMYPLAFGSDGVNPNPDSYGHSFPKGDNGGYLFSPGMVNPVHAWSGTVYEAVPTSNPPKINNLQREIGQSNPDPFVLFDEIYSPPSQVLEVPEGFTGSVAVNGSGYFQNGDGSFAFVRIGPYNVVYNSREDGVITPTLIRFHFPNILYRTDRVPNTYDLIVTGGDGQIAIKQGCIKIVRA